MVEAPGTVAGVTAFDKLDDAPVPKLLIAVTINVYAVPLVSPAKVAVWVEPPVVTVWPPGLAVILYPVIDEPPVDAGALQLTEASALPAVAVTLMGAPGTVAGVTVFDKLDDAPVPTLLVAATSNM